MFINQIRGHNLPNADGTFTDRIDDPDWATIERAIRALDGVHAMSLELRHVPVSKEQGPTRAGQGSFMGISGGARNAYSIFISDPNGLVHVLEIRPDGADFSDEALLEQAPRPTLAVAIHVAHTYVFHGQRDCSFSWWKVPS